MDSSIYTVSGITSDCQDVKNAKTDSLKDLSECPQRGKKEINERFVIYPLSRASRGKQRRRSVEGEKLPKSSKNNSALFCSKFNLYLQHELPVFKDTLYTDKTLLL